MPVPAAVEATTVTIAIAVATVTIRAVCILAPRNERRHPACDLIGS
eukprot:CAMPEP_0179909874 /NCGR_PEP_ID=MMETSP0982-20121206/45464_1 /TAXON_ID=483367 /ORGANISM="non described non described, Strain CCMP 2436" /LENGTH=45 /DNA_ID= /DNA_START= /DNA_END= /DNA_ORIENTATION=